MASAFKQGPPESLGSRASVECCPSFTSAAHTTPCLGKTPLSTANRSRTFHGPLGPPSPESHVACGGVFNGEWWWVGDGKQRLDRDSGAQHLYGPLSGLLAADLLLEGRCRFKAPCMKRASRMGSSQGVLNPLRPNRPLRVSSRHNALDRDNSPTRKDLQARLPKDNPPSPRQHRRRQQQQHQQGSPTQDAHRSQHHRHPPSSQH